MMMNGYIDTLEKIQFIKYIHTVWEERISYEMNPVQKQIYEYIKNGDSEIIINPARRAGTSLFLETLAIAGSRLGYKVLMISDSIHMVNFRKSSNIAVCRSYSIAIGHKFDIVLIDYVKYDLPLKVKTLFTKPNTLIIDARRN